MSIEVPKDSEKTRYFAGIGLRVREAWPVHKGPGRLWEQEEGSKRDWGNVSEHCLVEATRFAVFADLLSLPSDIKAEGMLAAAVHDVTKRQEKELPQPITWEMYEEQVSQVGQKWLKDAGFTDRVIRLAGAQGHDSLPEVSRILGKENLLDEDIAFLVLHYIDNYTVGSDWVTPVKVSLEDGVINDLDRRMNQNEANWILGRLNEDAVEILGNNLHVVQRQIGHKVEEIIANLIYQRYGQTIESRKLPEFVDQIIKDRIRTREI